VIAASRSVTDLLDPDIVFAVVHLAGIAHTFAEEGRQILLRDRKFDDLDIQPRHYFCHGAAKQRFAPYGLMRPTNAPAACSAGIR
jgi:hypothetical protein